MFIKIGKFIFLVFLILSLIGFIENAGCQEEPFISMDFQDIDLKDVLKVFSQQAGLNFVASENVKDRKVTLYLDKVTVADALEALMEANNLVYEQAPESQIFIVKEWGRPMIETVTRVYHLQYARVVSAEEGKDSKDVSGEKSIGEVLKQVLTEHGQIIEDARTNSLIITDIPAQFDLIERTIKELDVQLPQVLIEAEVIEVSSDLLDEIGLRWGSTNEGTVASASGNARFLDLPFADWTDNQVTAQPTGLYTGFINTNSLTVYLDLLTRDTNTKVLARPRILVLDNQRAEIKITADTAIASLTETSSAEGIATQQITAERVETGVKLDVTPQINREDMVTMTIEPAVITTEPSSYFSDFVDPQTRSIKTTVAVEDGKTVVIGGLISRDKSVKLRKVPFLGDIPVLGLAFRHKENKVEDKELIIFITPRVVREGSGLHREVSQLSQGLGRERAIDGILNQIQDD